MPTFTVQCEYPALYRTTVTVEAQDTAAACRAAIDTAGQTDAWKGIDHEQPTYIVALAEGDDVDPWTLDPTGADASTIPIPPVFTDVAQLAGYAATRADDLVMQLRIMVDAIGAVGAPRIEPDALLRLRNSGITILQDVDRCGLPVTTARP